MIYQGKIYDYHLHSSFSMDACSRLEEICRQAEKKGAAGFMLTDHIEYDNSSGGEYNFDHAAYAEALAAAAKKFPNLELGGGVELGLQEHLKARCLAAVNGHNWDFVLGSVHIVKGRSVYDGAFSRGKSREEAYRAYLEEVYRIVCAMPFFDVLAHLDLIRRDERFADRSLVWREFPDQLDAILRKLVETGVGLELNTASWRYGLDSPHPDESVLRRYRELGGEIITCGSDSHEPSTVCYKLREGYQILKEAGFRYVSTFRQRRLRQVPLE